MASLPARQASQRHASPEQSSNPAASSSQTPRSQSRARSTTSEDSQTVLLNPPSTATTPKTEQRRPLLPQEDPDVKKCWICFADETEDTPQTSRWRDPCPCALVAHEECLLDWIADMESPSARKRTLAPPQLLCPQCKSEIHLARPRDPIVEVVRASERLAAKVVTPAALAVAASTIIHACTLHGVHSVYAIFGHQDGWRILKPAILPDRWFGSSSIQHVFQDFFLHWRLHVGLPLITPMLVLSRTTFADSVLPVLPIVFFATQGDSDQPLDFGHWPPSASLAMAVLPYLRGLYNAYYERVWAVHEKRWLKDIQPRNGQSGQNENNGEQDAEANEAPAEEEGIFEIRVDGNIWEDWNGDEEQENPQQLRERQEVERQLLEAERELELEREHIRRDMMGEGLIPDGEAEEAPPLNAPPLADDQPAAAPQIRRANRPRPNPQPQPQPQPQQGGQERRLSISTTGLAEKVLGALLFPTIAGLSGEALRLLLPASWTSAPASRWGRSKATGLLQERWGRSIVGGCLFVVVKDAVMLYVRWRMSQQHRKRKVLDYDRRKSKAGGR